MTLVGVCVVVLLLAVPVMADNTTIKDNNVLLGEGNTGIQGNRNHHNTVVGGIGEGSLSPTATATATGGDASIYKSGNSEVNVGNSLFGDTFSPSATIEEGAVDVDNRVCNTNFNTNFNKNENTNKNYNTNFNTLHQGQGQDQDQMQMQGQGQMQGNINKIHIEAEEPKRDLPGGGGGTVALTSGPDHREPAGPTPNEGTAEELMSVRTDWTLGQLVVLSGKSGDIECDNRAYNSYREALGNPKKGTKDMDMKSIISLTTELPSGKDVGLFICKGDSETDGAGVVAHAAIEAIRHGATKFYVSKNDFKKLLEASGWGVSFGGSGSTIVNDGGSNAVGAVVNPGLGYVSSESSYAKEPFVRGFGFK
jgi:hypothetical protein